MSAQEQKSGVESNQTSGQSDSLPIVAWLEGEVKGGRMDQEEATQTLGELADAMSISGKWKPIG